MLAALVLVTAVGAAPLKLATVGFSQVGMSDAQASFFAEHFSTKLAEDDAVRVTTPKDMAAVIGVEKQKQLLGCASEASSCMAELAGALGADGLVTGQLAKVGKSYQLNVKVLAADGSRTLFVHSSKLLSSEEDLIEELNDVAPQLTRRVRALLAPAGASADGVSLSSSAPARGGRSLVKLVPGAVGVAAVVVGAVGLSMASSNLNQLYGTARLADPGATRDSGKTDLAWGLSCVIGGAVVLLASVLWFLLT